jgi:hypothetical protein
VGASGKPLTPLQQAVKDVHRVFRRVPKPTELETLQGIYPLMAARFLEGDRSELTAEDLYNYVDDAIPEYPELAYFIPRFCEIMANGESTNTSIVGWVCSLTFLELSDFPSAWPDDQVQALQRFVEALLVDYVNEPARFSDAESIGQDVANIGELLCMAGKGGIDIDGVTTALAQADKQSLARALAQWITDECYCDAPIAYKPDFWRGDLADGFWEGEDFQKPVFDWLFSLEPWHMFAAAAERETDPVWRDDLSYAAGYCDLWLERPRGIPRD